MRKSILTIIFLAWITATCFLTGCSNSNVMFRSDDVDAVFCIMQDTEVRAEHNDLLKLINIDGKTFDSTEGITFAVQKGTTCIEPTGTNGIIRSNKVSENTSTILTATKDGKSCRIRISVMKNCDFSYLSGMRDVYVPYGVTDIGWAFRERNIESIVIPSTVMTIDDSAFNRCELLTSVSLPDTITKIGNNAFKFCKKLSDINIPKNIIELGNGAFRQCSSIEKIAIPSSLDEVPAFAFYVCSSLREVSLPQSIKTIGKNAFGQCSNLQSVIIPDSVGIIEEWAFADCSSLKYVNLNKGLTGIYDSAFTGCKSLKQLIIPDTVKRVGEQSFSNCDSLTSIKLPITLEYGLEAFVGTSNIKSIEFTGKGSSCDFNASNYTCSPWYNSRKNKLSIKFNEGITQIGKYYFVKCDGIEVLELPKSLKKIGYSSFRKCNKLKAVLMNENLKVIGDYAFSIDTALVNIKIPESVTSIGKGAFDACTSLIKIEIPNKVKTIGLRAFRGCNGLTKIELGTNGDSELEQIGEDAFAGQMSRCKIVKIHSKKVKEIGDRAFGSYVEFEDIEDEFFMANGAKIEAPESILSLFRAGYNYNDNYNDLVVK